MTFDEWFDKVQNAKSGGLLFLFNRLLREFDSCGINVEYFSGDISFCISESLKLPDLCGHVIWPDKKPRDRYKAWLAEFVVPYMIPNDCSSLSVINDISAELYLIRNNVVHELFVFEGFAFCNPLFGHYVHSKKMQSQLNLLNVCMQISRTAIGFYLEHYSDFDILGKNYSANRRIYHSEFGLDRIREFARLFFIENPDMCH